MVKTAVILAAGLGLRLKKHSLKKPKAFLNIGGTILLERSIAILVQNGIEEIIIGTGFCSEDFESFANEHRGLNIKCVKSERYASTGSMFTLYNLSKDIFNPFILLESDLLYEDMAIKVLQSDVRENVILASDLSNAGDEVFIETNSFGIIDRISKDKNDLRALSAEFVGINKLSIEAYQAFCEFFEANCEDLQNAHYENSFPLLGPQYPFFVNRQDSLIWCEIDDKNHLRRAKEIIFPLILQKQERTDYELKKC